MYCKMYWIANGAILKKNNVWKILVELYSAILVRFSIFSIQVELIVLVPYEYSVPQHIQRYYQMTWRVFGDDPKQVSKMKEWDEQK